MFRYYEETDLVHAALHGQDNEDDQRQDESDDDESEVDAPIEETLIIGCCYAESTNSSRKQEIRCQTMKQWIGLKR